MLVADDDPELLSAVSQALELLGARVSRAESGAELVMRLAHDEPYALVVTDIAMPWTSGVDVMRAARRRGVDAPVIVMTALPEEEVTRQVQSLGEHVALLRKPFDLADLTSTAETMLLAA